MWDAAAVVTQSVRQPSRAIQFIEDALPSAKLSQHIVERYRPAPHRRAVPSSNSAAKQCVPMYAHAISLESVSSRVAKFMSHSAEVAAMRCVVMKVEGR